MATINRLFEKNKKKTKKKRQFYGTAATPFTYSTINKIIMIINCWRLAQQQQVERRYLQGKLRLEKGTHQKLCALLDAHTKKNNQKKRRVQIFLKDQNQSEMYNMSVSIHHTWNMYTSDSPPLLLTGCPSAKTLSSLPLTSRGWGGLNHYFFFF